MMGEAGLPASCSYRRNRRWRARVSAVRPAKRRWEKTLRHSNLLACFRVPPAALRGRRSIKLNKMLPVISSGRGSAPLPASSRPFCGRTAPRLLAAPGKREPDAEKIWLWVSAPWSYQQHRQNKTDAAPRPNSLFTRRSYDPNRRSTLVRGTARGVKGTAGGGRQAVNERQVSPEGRRPLFNHAYAVCGRRQRWSWPALRCSSPWRGPAWLQ